MEQTPKDLKNPILGTILDIAGYGGGMTWIDEKVCSGIA
jgi:hypothetical protein